MESTNELKQIDIKNLMCYCFNNINKIEDFHFDNILIGEKSGKNILVYNISYKTLIDTKPLRLRFDKVDGFIRLNYGTRYLFIYRFRFDSQKYNVIFNKIRYLIGIKTGITYIFSHNYANIKVDLYD